MKLGSNGKNQKKNWAIISHYNYSLSCDLHSTRIKVKKKMTAISEAKKAKNIEERLLEISPFLNLNEYSESLVILVNMAENMSSKRMYVANPSEGKILHSCLVMHGKGGGSDADKAIFSNTPNSLCSSLGKYKIAERYVGRFGESYRLDGLDTTNSNARKRAIVFHYYEPQSALENIGPHFFSEGCPMLAESDWRKIDKLIKKEDKPVILWMYK